MKYAVAAVLLILGLAALGTCVVLRSQGKRLAANENVNVGDNEFWLIRKLMPAPAPGPPVPASQIAVITTTIGAE